MSEDDTDMLGPDGQTPARVDRDRRAPRFSWTPAYEATFFRSLCDSVSLGLRENSSFKAEAWERAAGALQEAHGAWPNKSHLINKSDNARKRFRLWRGLREDPEFLYNPVSRTVTATEDAWRAHIEREPLSRALRGRPFEHEDFMEILYPDVIGSGGAPKRIMKPRRRTDGPVMEEPETPGPGVLNIPQNEPPPPPEVESPNQQRPSLSQTPTGSSTNSVPQQQPQPQLQPQPQPRPMATAIPPRAPVANISALTPPDETLPQNRKRQLPVNTPAHVHVFDSTPPTSNVILTEPVPVSPEKRRRTSSHDGPRPIPSTATLNSSIPPVSVDIPTEPPLTHTENRIASRASASILEEVLDVLRTRSVPRWREEALDVFFRDFATEDPDLQIKISENILSNESKAMVFCKMPTHLRQHWVQRFRELHHKSA